MQFEKIVVVDDDPVIRRMLVSHLQRQGIPVLGLCNVKQALEEQEREPGDLLVCDLHLPDGSGMDIMQAARKADPTTEVIIMTGFGTIESAVEAMKLGAANYLLKPFTLDQFDLALSQLMERRQLRGENAYLREQLAAESIVSELQFRSVQMQHVHSLIKRIAPTDATVLIQGESGTGKELVSRAVFENSLRRGNPYIKVNCAAVPENLLESEFFGHEKGAFTGAINRREGRFELAHTGTLLLDEVTEISLALQAKLLRVLQEREFERVGGTRSIKVDVRVIATTNRDLGKAVESGEFRQDLFYRLNVVPLKIPPLRERLGDVEHLLAFFLEKFARRNNKSAPRISPHALAQLQAYDWPGNVRELQNYVERAVILSDPGRDLEFADFMMLAPPSLPAPATGSDPSAPVGNPAPATFLDADEIPTVEEMERRLIARALQKTAGNRNDAAQLLGINVRTLRNKLHQYADEGHPLPAAGASDDS
jgi:DNA-binding NtrC family response regulator